MESDRQLHAARRLREAYVSGAVAPLRDCLDPTDAVGAYAVQAQLGVDQPDFGVLFDDVAVADGGTLDPARCLQPKAEAEIVFVLGADLPSPDTPSEQVAAAVAGVHAAIEIVDGALDLMAGP